MSQPSIVVCKCDTDNPETCVLAQVYGEAPKPLCPCLCHRVAALERRVGGKPQP